MHGVTTALVGFLLVCVVFPNLVKNRPQYYAAFAAVCLIVILDALGLAISGTALAGFRVFAYVICAFLQVAALVLMFLACGGLTFRELADDMKGALEVIRRGGDEKEIIIPLSPEMQRLKEQREAERGRSPATVTQDETRERIVINDPAPPPAARKPAAENQEKGSIPLEP